MTGLTVTSEPHQTSKRMFLNISSPDCLVIQPAGCTAGKAVIVCCPQLGWCGHLSRHFLAGLPRVAK